MADEKADIEEETASIRSASPRSNYEHLSNEQLDAIAKKLLDHKFYLTALEFHAELVEIGRELIRLKDFFSNPANFEIQMKLDPLLSVRKTPSVLTLDSIDDFARYSDDGIRDVDEKVTVLEFELRKATETIQALRQSITELTADKKEKEFKQDCSNEIINPYEIRTLNFLVNEYLLKREYKLTSITFADEAANQDLDDWEDVGLNTEQPPELLQLLRDYAKHAIDPVKMRNAEMLELRNEIRNLKNTSLQLETDLLVSESEKQKMAKQIEDLNLKNNWNLGKKYIRIEDDNISVKSNSSDKITNNPNIRVEITPDYDDSHEKNNTRNDITEEENKNFSNDFKVADQSSNIASKHQHFKEIGNLESRVSSPESIDTPEDSALAHTHIESPDDSIDVAASDHSKLPEGDHVRDSQSTPDEFYARLTSGTEKGLISKKFFEALYDMTQAKGESRLSKEVSKEGDLDPVCVIANSLPNIVPNVLLNKREELIPLILCAVRYHGEPRVRDELLHTLFNLIKRPNKEQRRIIINGCVSFAKIVEPIRIEGEFLPQCWEQINHKFAERRLLVSETCGCLAPFIPGDLLGSLVFSMLSQMLQEDRSDEVRCSVIKNFSLICSFLTDSAKYSQTFSLLELALNDIVVDVVEDAKNILFPVVAVWALKMNKLYTHLIAPLLKSCHQTLKTWHDAIESSGRDQIDSIMITSEKKFKIYIECLVNTVTITFANTIKTAPFRGDDLSEFEDQLSPSRLPAMKNILLNVDAVLDDSETLCKLVNKFDDVMKNEYEGWEDLSLICDMCILKTCEMSVLTLVSHSLIDKLVCYVSTICRVFGRNFTYVTIVPCFEKLIRNTGAEFLNGVSPIASPLLPLFICGVLATYQGDEQEKKLFTFLKQCMLTISTQGLSKECLTLSILLLCKSLHYQSALIQMLRETIVYPVPEVRLTTCHLFEVLVKSLSTDLLSSQVAPSIISLINDRDISVKIAAIPALGNLLEVITDKTLLDKVSLQFQMLLDDPVNQQNVSLRLTVVKTFTKVLPAVEYKFRDEFLIPRLRVIAETNNVFEDLNDRIDLAEEIIHSLGAALCCFLPKEVISTYIIPTLKCLENDLKDVSPETLDSVVILRRDAENKCDDDRSSTGSGTVSSASRLFGGISTRLERFKKKK